LLNKSENPFLNVVLKKPVHIEKRRNEL